MVIKDIRLWLAGIVLSVIFSWGMSYGATVWYVDAVVGIYGGFDGTETELTDRDRENDVTNINGDNSVRCLNITLYGKIDRFTIRNGSASSGAGIYIDSVLLYCLWVGICRRGSVTA